MDDKTEQLITKLAEKLGTTADHLWSVLIHQAPIDSLIDLAAFAICGAFLAAMWRALFKYVKPMYDDEPMMWLTILMLLLSGVFVCVLASNAADIVSGFINPEFWALKELMSLK